MRVLYIDNREDIASLLGKKDKNAAEDLVIFNKWMNKEISTKRTIELFKENNHIEEDIQIDEKAFEDWLRSLGYRKEISFRWEHKYRKLK